MTKFTKNQKIPVPEIVFDTIEFDSTSPCLLTFNEGSTLNVDSDTLYLMNSNTKFYHLIVTSDSLKVSGREATHVDVGSDSYSITYQGQSEKSLDHLVVYTHKYEFQNKMPIGYLGWDDDFIRTYINKKNYISLSSSLYLFITIK